MDSIGILVATMGAVLAVCGFVFAFTKSNWAFMAAGGAGLLVGSILELIFGH